MSYFRDFQRGPKNIHFWYKVAIIREEITVENIRDPEEFTEFLNFLSDAENLNFSLINFYNF